MGNAETKGGSGNKQCPWRKAKPFTTEHLESLKERIEHFSPPPALKLSEARILLIGLVRSGKSSVCNTMASPFRGRISQEAICGSSLGSLTTKYRQYRVRSALTGKFLNFCLCDTCGIDEHRGPQIMELEWLLEGLLPNGYQFNQSTPKKPRIFGLKGRPKLADMVHCVVFVIDGSSVSFMPQWAWDKFITLQMLLNMRGIPRLVFLTKIDQISKTVAGDLSKIYESREVIKIIDKVTHRLGVPELNVLPIKNYCTEIDLDENIDILALTALDKALAFTEDFLLCQMEVLEGNSKHNMDEILFFATAGCTVFITIVVFMYFW